VVLIAAGFTGRPAEPPAGIIVVANQESGSATLVDLPSGTTMQIPVGEGPHEAAVTADGRLGIVTIYGARTPGSQLAVIDLASRRVVRTIELGELRRPHGVVGLQGDPSRVVVTSEVAGRVLIVDVITGKVDTTIETKGRGSHMVALTADGRHAFTANVPDGSISEIDMVTKRLVRTVPVASMTEGVAVTPDGGEVWVGSNDRGTVTVFDTRSGAVAATITGFEMPYRLAVSPDGRRVAVCDPKANSVHVVDAATRRIVGAISRLGSPRGVTIARDNRTAFITLGDDSAVVVVDLETRAILSRHAVGASPDGVAFATR
ncbi:MAG: YncE family protein, partial [Gemmatimonadales bacterium]|nr:YncE family protein [Gemmatimonadales bacterium]